MVQSNRRPQQQQPGANANAGNAAAAGAGSTQTATAPPPQTPPNAAPAADGSNGQANETAQSVSGRNPAQPTVNINIQPDPITYQVEIETRVPIAFPLENALFNGLNATVVNNQEQNPPQNQAGQAGQNGLAGQTTQAGQNGQAGQGGQAAPAGQASQGGQTGQAGQANRRQVLLGKIILCH